jgi:chromosome segregation ATPase
MAILLCAGAVLLPALAGCEQWNRMEANQVRLEALVAANARQLATISSQVYVGEARLSEGIQGLDENTQQVAAGVVAVQDEQRQFRSDVANSNEQLAAKIADVRANQDTLETHVTQVAEVTRGTASDVTALAQEHAGLQQTVRSNQQELTGRLGTLADSQQQIRTGIGQLQEADAGLATSLTAMAGGQTTLQETLVAHRQESATGLTSLSDGQRQLQTGVTTLSATADRTTANLAQMSSSLQATLQDNHENVKTQIATLAQNQQNEQTALNVLNEKADRAAGEFASATSTLQDNLRVTREVLTGQMAASLQNQQSLQTTAQELDTRIGTLNAGVGEVAATQTAVHEAVKTNHAAVIARLGDLSESQATLGGSLNRLNERTEAVVAAEDSLRRLLENRTDTINGQLAGFCDWRQTMQNQLDVLTATTGQTALDLLAMGDHQNALQEAVQRDNAAAVEQMAGLADGQRRMQDSMNTVTTTAAQTALDVAAVAEHQSALREAVQQNDAAANERLAHLADGQGRMQDSMNTIAATTGQTAQDVTAVAQQQNTLREAVQQNHATVSGQMTRLADGQQQVQTGVSTITATSGQTALDVAAVAKQQNTLAEAVQQNHAAVSGQMTRLADGQQQVQNGLDIITATTGQTALDVLAATQQQDTLRQTLQQDNAAINGQMAGLAQAQQQMQTGVDTITATTGQTALDGIAMSNSQTRMEQAMQAGRAELVAKLGGLAQEQQNLPQRLETVQARVNALADGVAALDQRLAALQGTLQTSIDGLKANLASEGEKRLQAEAKVIQDLQAVVEAVAQLRQTQASLREQVTQAQRDTRTPAETIEPAAEQPKPQPPTEVKVSDAGPLPPPAEADAK